MSDRRTADVDAIIVPTARSSESLREVAALARELDCTLVALCSRSATAARAMAEIGGPGLKLVAVDVPTDYRHKLVDFDTSTLADARYGRDTDLSLKRNLGLLIARMSGWSRVVFLDDDITVNDPDHLGQAARLLDQCEAAGLTLGGYPDHSVVCHAHRIAGGTQETFVGGGALAIDPQQATGFFPDIYNEDWFFLLDDGRLRPVALTGLAVQQPYDPFFKPRRAESEEFGDVLAEGVYWLLDQGKRVEDADEDHWDWFLSKRAQFIADVSNRVRMHDLPETERVKMLASLEAAERRRSEITSASLADYLRRWQKDRIRWETDLLELPSAGEPATMAEVLDLLLLEAASIAD